MAASFARGSRGKRTNRLPNLPCGTCREKIKSINSSRSGCCPHAAAVAFRDHHLSRWLAIATALACISSTPIIPVTTAIRFKLLLPRVNYSGKDTAGPLPCPPPSVVVAGDNRGGGGIENHKTSQSHDTNEEREDFRATNNCPRGKSNSWWQVIGATLLINLAAFVSIRIALSKTMEGSCLRSKTVVSLGAASSSLLLVVMTVCHIFPLSADLMMIKAALNDDDAESSPKNGNQVGLMAFCGFLLPIMISIQVSCRHRPNDILGPNNNDNDDDGKAGNNKVDEEDPSTVYDQDDALSCESCMQEYQHLLPVGGGGGGGGADDESIGRLTPPPRFITFHNECTVGSASLFALLKEETSSITNVVVWRTYLFLHGLFIGAAAIASCSWDDGTFMLIGVIALFHIVYLEQQTVIASIFHSHTGFYRSVFKNWLRGMLSRSLITLGGITVTALLGRSTLDLFVVGAMLAVAGGVYINIAITMAIAQVKHWIRPHDLTAPRSSCQSSRLKKFARHDKNRTRQALHQFYHNPSLTNIESLTRYCMPCAEDNVMPMQHQEHSKAQPIPTQRRGESDAEREYRDLTGIYDHATWSMYTRIVSARQARARCEICMGSVDENDAKTVAVGNNTRKNEEAGDDIITVKSNGEEERRLQTCPFPLYFESNDQPEHEREAATETSVMKVHQECYYGATACARRNVLLEENMAVFQLDL